MLVLDTDHTRFGLGLYGERTALLRTWCRCQGCALVLSEVRYGHTVWDQGYARADASSNGGRWRAEPDGVSRLYCPACQATRDGGKFGWMDCSAKVVGAAPTPRALDVAA